MKQNVFFEININAIPSGRIEFKLYDDIVTKTARNFRELCTGENGFGYRGSTFHKIVPEFMIQGGDITHFDGTGGKSIYGDTFNDESYDLKFSKPFLLAMANGGEPNTNSSQFFITLTVCPWLNHKNVIVGEVASGHELVKQISELEADDGTPKIFATIVNSGLIEMKMEKKDKPSGDVEENENNLKDDEENDDDNQANNEENETKDDNNDDDETKKNSQEIDVL
ncbi:hypothetical protein SNEBB_006022 [Seison nebaliae]|nr:hypothetical protein SNEBB_006022 [Seison nebaliae]